MASNSKAQEMAQLCKSVIMQKLWNQFQVQINN